MSEDPDREKPDSIPLSDLRSDLEGEDPADSDSTLDGEETADSDSVLEGEATERSSQHSPREQTAETAAESVPLSGLRDELDRTHGEDPPPEESEAGAFVEESVEPVDSDGIWADLLMEDENPEGQFEPTEAVSGPDGTTQVISKRICERCPYLEEPPTLECTHEGTTIHELVDVDHVRVSSCPMVGPEGERKSDRSTPLEQS